MIISHRHKFVFVHIHKTAGDSITYALLPHLAWNDIVIGPTPLGKFNLLYYRDKKIRKHSTAVRIRDFLGEAAWNEYRVFSVVRNPVDRLSSLYYFCERAAKNHANWNVRKLYRLLPGIPGADVSKWPSVQAYMQTKSFSGFIRHPLLHGTPGMWRQSDILSDADHKLIVDRIARYETLPADFAEICREIGLRNVNLGWKNASKNRDADHSHISPEDIAYIEALFEPDFRAFYPDLLSGRAATDTDALALS